MNVNIIRSKVAEMLVSVHIPKVLVGLVCTLYTEGPGGILFATKKNKNLSLPLAGYCKYILLLIHIFTVIW